MYAAAHIPKHSFVNVCFLVAVFSGPMCIRQIMLKKMLPLKKLVLSMASLRRRSQHCRFDARSPNLVTQVQGC